MTERVQQGGLQIAKGLYDLLENDIAPGTGVAPETFWAELEAIVTELGPENQALLTKRDSL